MSESGDGASTRDGSSAIDIGAAGAGGGAGGAGGGGGRDGLAAAERLLGAMLEAAAFEAVDIAATDFNMAQVAGELKATDTRGDPEVMEKWKGLLEQFKELEGDLWALNEQFDRLDAKREEIRTFVLTEGKRMLEKAAANNTNIQRQAGEMDKQNERIVKLQEGQKALGAPGFCVTKSDTFFDSRGCLICLLVLGLLLTAICVAAVLRKFKVITIDE
uniref:Uncharacterized protein n=1 Tax=Bicosoecida sp. CB-2014 TaxID=1486930 RepID=A0A7S1C2M5_9STRA